MINPFSSKFICRGSDNPSHSCKYPVWPLINILYLFLLCMQIPNLILFLLIMTTDIEPMVNMRVGSRISAVGAPICPYLAAQGLSIGVPSPQVEGSHVGHHHSSRFSRRRAGVYHSTSQRNFGSSQTSATSSSMQMPYEGISRSISTSSFSRSNSNPQHNLGFLVPNPQSLHAG